MSILTANINFLASLGITTSEQFTAAFGDMADFTEYCTAIGYSWELDENNDIILITPNGNKVNTYVPAEEPEKTATPEIVVTPGDTEYTFAAIGDGDVKLYIDETEVSNPVAISRTSEDQEITVTATAQEQGKQISDEAVEEVTIPALSGPTSIQFDSASYSISGVEHDPSLQQNFTITDNLGNDVTNDCTITLYPNNTGIIVTGDLIDATAMTAGAYTITMTATYEGMTATAAINADIAAPAPQSISFDSNTYTITANEGESNPTSFVVEDDLGNDVTNDCTYSFSPNNTGVYIANGAFYTDQMSAGAYTVTITATYGELTATATLDISIDAPVAEDIYFDSASYSLTGTAGDPSLTQSFTVEDDLGNDVTNDCTITLYPANTGIIVSGGLIDATAMSEGLYHITMTATYGELTATSTIDADIAALPITATPTISYTQGLTAYTITATGDGTVLLYADGTAVQNPCSISRTTTAQTITFTATAQETGKQISATATEVINIPAMEVTPTPVITYDSTTFTVDVTGNGTVLAYVDGVQTQMPHTFTQGASAITYVVTATAQETGKQISATATENCLVPAAVIKDYMKLSVLNESGNDGDITITIPAAVTSSQATSLSYSKDGSNWTDTTIDNTAQTITIPVNAGDEVYLKGIANQWAIGANNNTKINSTRMNFAVSGNVMSLFYGDNFENQTSFPSSPKYTLSELFRDNSHLIDASRLELPATTLTQYCYYSMFANCTSLTTAPALPATTLAAGCYYSMFANCTSLTTAPALPATVLQGSMFAGCYNDMFKNCTSLTTAPALPATTLTQYCYNNMFQGCRNLNSITMLAEDISASNCLTNWVNNVARNGTFTKSANMTTLPTGQNGIPDGWTVVDRLPNYLTLEVIDEAGNDGDITITIPAAVTSSQATSLSYSYDGSNWTDTAVDSTDQTITIPVSVGDEVYLKGIAKQWSTGSNSTKINSTRMNFAVSGNVMSLFYGDNFENQTSFPANSTYNLNELFKDNTHLIDASQLELPATTLATSCYSGMFDGCTSLTSAPDLPATTLATSCYGYMFKNCTSLTTAPDLPATTLPSTTILNWGCYEGMFDGCTSLTSAPDLPATTLTNNCYRYMFRWCTSLTSAPDLPATTLVRACYNSMFYGCTSLTSAPDLPATTLAQSCYQEMFSGCTSLNNITMLAEDISASNCLNSWVSGVASTGTFTKAASQTSLPTGVSGIPDNWTVVDYTP